MLKKLKIRFVLINLFIVFVMLSIIFTTILGFTKYNLIKNSIEFMDDISDRPILLLKQAGQGVQYPFFIVDVSENKAILKVNTGYYDIANDEQLKDLIEKADKRTGVLDDYNLRYYSEKTQNIERFIFVDISGEMKTMQDLTQNLLIIGGISFLVFFFISVILAYWVAKPVKKAWEQQNVFMSDASHELKTPLTVITTNAELIERNIDDTVMIKKRMEHITASADRMKGLTNNLLTLGRAEDLYYYIHKESVNLSDIVTMQALSYEALFFEKDFVLYMDIEKNLFTLGDETVLTQLVSIFLDNAYKYTTEKGHINIELRKTNRKNAVLVVTNHGEHIEKENLDKIFDRFYRVDTSRTKQEGCGLGLAIAKTITKQHQGKIWAESINNENSFFVKLKIFENL